MSREKCTVEKPRLTLEYLALRKYCASFQIKKAIFALGITNSMSKHNLQCADNVEWLNPICPESFNKEQEGRTDMAGKE